MDNTYEILMKEDFAWSLEFKEEMKVQLLTLLIEYFTDVEDYEKCAHLNKLLINLENMNENISETTSSGSNKS